VNQAKSNLTDEMKRANHAVCTLSYAMRDCENCPFMPVVRGADWYSPRQTDLQVIGILTANVWQEGEVEAHHNSEINERIQRNGLTLKPVMKLYDGRLYENYIYTRNED